MVTNEQEINNLLPGYDTTGYKLEDFDFEID